jgi:formylmethanofuran dehydrogenase subunit B
VSTADLDASETEAVTCLGCGCLCDDLTTRVVRGRIVDIGCECELGLRWFSRSPEETEGPAAWVDGRVVEVAEALDRAGELLRQSRAPLLFGLTQTSTEAVREALALADRIGARVWLDRTEADLGRVAAFSQSGRVSATLGEVKNRADVVVFLGGDPIATHPRHGERYSAEARGRFISGRQSRFVAIVGEPPSSASFQADLFVSCSPRAELEFLTMARALVKRGRVDHSRFGARTAIEPSLVSTLVSRLDEARYGAIFYRCRQESFAYAAACWEVVSALVTDLNGSGRRFVLLGMGSAGNTTGAEAALAWQTGYARNVDFRLGAPTPIEEFSTVGEVIEQGGVDALVLIGIEKLAILASPRDLPVIAIAPGASPINQPTAQVAIATRTAGIDGAGTVMRSDGVALPLRPPLRSRRPGVDECLRGLLARIETKDGPSDV